LIAAAEQMHLFSGLFQGLEKISVKFSNVWKNPHSPFPMLGKL
jgi:hypothetical protein